MAYKYTQEQKAQALILLAANRGDTALTAAQLGITQKRISLWAQREDSVPSPEIGKAMEAAIHYVLSQIPNLVNKYNVADVLGVLLDKWLHYQGIPQNSTQTILAILGTKTEDQLDRMISDIDQGRQLALTEKGHIGDLRNEMAKAGLIGFDETPETKAATESPPEVIDLIDYTTYEPDEDAPEVDHDW